MIRSFQSLLLLVEDLLKERVEPYPNDITRSRSFTVQQTKPASRHQSPIPPPSPPPPPPRAADDIAIPIATPPVLTPLPRLPTPPLLPASPPPDKLLSPLPDKPVSPPPEKPESPPPEKPPTPLSEPPVSPSPELSIRQASELPPPYIVNYEKIRRGMRFIRI